MVLDSRSALPSMSRSPVTLTVDRIVRSRAWRYRPQDPLGFLGYVSPSYPCAHRLEQFAIPVRRFRPLAIDSEPEAVSLSQTCKRLRPGGTTSHKQARKREIRAFAVAVNIAVSFNCDTEGP